MPKEHEDMSTESPAANARVYAPLPREDIARLSGLEVLEGILRGDLPAAPFAAATGIEPVHVEPGLVVFEGQPSASFLNPLGSVHGGWIATLLDSAMACAVHSQLAPGQAYTTVEMKVSYLRAIGASSPRVRCEGRIVHLGGRLAVAEGRVTDGAGRLLAHGTETCMIFEPRAA
jgi:uncharacterized protein (TIGR00369 family)